MAAKLSYVIWTEIETEDLKIFTGTLKKMWRKCLIRVDIQRMKTGHYPSETIKGDKPDER